MKKMFSGMLAAGALVLATVAGVQAQDEARMQDGMQVQNGGGGTLTLDLGKALEIALSDNPTILAADMEIERFDYVRRETLGSHLPQLSAGGQYAFNIVKQQMSKGLSLGADMSAAVTADLSIPLFAPAIYAGLKMNRTQQALAVEQARSSRIELVNGVTKAFYQILLLDKSYGVLKESEKTIGATVDNTRTMYEAGLASEYDLLTAEVQLSNLQPNIISVENSMSVAKQMLKMYLSIPEEVTIALEGSLDDYRDRVYAEPSGEVDLDGNSELRQLDFQQQLVRGQIKLANAARMPVLAAYGSFIATGQDKTIDFQGMMAGGSGVVNKWWWQNPFNAGFQLSVPIFSGLKNTNKVKQLRNTSAQIDLQRNYLREAKLLEANSATNNLLAARETMFANEKTVAQAEKAYSIARTRFDAGAGTMLEVNQAELNVTRSRLNHSQAIYDFLAAKADYDKVTGVEYK